MKLLQFARGHSVVAVAPELGEQFSRGLFPRAGFIRDHQADVFWQVEDIMEWISRGQTVILGGPYPWKGVVAEVATGRPQFGRTPDAPADPAPPPAGVRSKPQPGMRRIPALDGQPDLAAAAAER